MQIKTMRYHLIPVRMAINKKSTTIYVGEDVEKRKPSYTVGRTINWYNHYEELEVLQKLKIELPYNPAIPLLGIHLEKNLV